MSQVQAFLETQDDPLDPDETTVYEALASLNLPGPSVEPPTFRELMDEIARSGSRPLSDVTVWRVLTVEERLWDRIRITVDMLIDGRSIPTRESES
jgi:hypothetical protein